ncbi:hypothetical protein LXT21_29940 [Myxococcus sp. K38C18041901]|uniref:hypothetical protein n=1 Tax=Myxococcus guangdongensis TaxID=2906760 RepID=UPI0020A748F3|nr:hypothetical protein [Myxococcus guangdongensis]MCP3063005.1 hypothetical protein [Myxococcus guangdongensis]
MKTTLPLTLAAVLASVGCSADDQAPLCTVSPATGLFTRDPVVVSLGTAVSLRMDVATLMLVCDDGRPAQAPDTATVEVLDPENHRVPAEVSLGDLGGEATVSFAPTTVGRHHVLLSFAPVGGVRQLGVHVASAWSGSPTPITLPLPRCGQLDRTTRGLWLCDGVAMRGTEDRPLRLGTATTPADVSISGNVVWVVGDGRVRRYVDTGTELELTDSLLTDVPGTQPLQGRLASEDELVVLDSERLHRFVLTDAGVLTMPPSTPWRKPGVQGRFGRAQSTGLLVRASAQRVLVVSLTGPGSPDSQACPFEPSEEGVLLPVTGEPCAPLRGIPVGLEDGALWTLVGSAQPLFPERTLYRWTLVGDRLTQDGALGLEMSLGVVEGSLHLGPTVPTLYSTTGEARLSQPRRLSGQPVLGLELLPTHFPLSEGSRDTSPRFHWSGDSRPLGGFTTLYEQARP